VNRLQAEEQQRTHLTRELQKKNDRIELLTEQNATLTSQLSAAETYANQISQLLKASKDETALALERVRTLTILYLCCVSLPQFLCLFLVFIRVFLLSQYFAISRIIPS